MAAQSPWLMLVPDVDYTISGNILTLTDGPSPGEDYLFYYSYLSPDNRHIHTSESRTGVWADSTWTLSTSPDLGDLRLLRTDRIASLWITDSDFSSTNNQKLRLWELTGSPSSLTMTQSAGPWNVPSGEIVSFLKSDTSQRVFLGTIRNGFSRLFRFDRGAGTFTKIFEVVHVPSEAGPWPWQMIVLSEDEYYLLLARSTVSSLNGIYHTTDGGQNWTHLSNPPFSAQNQQAFSESPSQAYSLALSGSRLYTLHTGQNNGAGVYWNVSHSDDAGGSWTRDAATIGQFSKGGRGFLFEVNEHLPYVAESFIDFVAGDVGHFAQVDVSPGDDASDAWVAAFSDGTILARTNSDTRRSTDYGATWGTVTPNGPAVGGPKDVTHKANVLRSKDWLVVPSSTAQSIKITTDKGTNWQTFSLPNWCGMAAFVGGVH